MPSIVCKECSHRFEIKSLVWDLDLDLWFTFCPVCGSKRWIEDED